MKTIPGDLRVLVKKYWIISLELSAFLFLFLAS